MRACNICNQESRHRITTSLPSKTTSGSQLTTRLVPLRSVPPPKSSASALELHTRPLCLKPKGIQGTPRWYPTPAIKLLPTTRDSWAGIQYSRAPFRFCARKGRLLSRRPAKDNISIPASRGNSCPAASQIARFNLGRTLRSLLWSEDWKERMRWFLTLLIFWISMRKYVVDSSHKSPQGDHYHHPTPRRVRIPQGGAREDNTSIPAPPPSLPPAVIPAQ